jgi:acetyl esterase
LKTLLAILLLTPLAAAGLRTDIEFVRAGDVRLLMDAWLPDGPGPFPAVIWVHGGGFTGGDKQPYPKEILQKVEQAGLAWFSVNYRLSPRFHFPDLSNDVESAVTYIKAHAADLHVDPNRLVLMGASAGAHLVSLAGVKHKPANRVAAVVALYGEHDLVGRVHPRGECAMDGHVIPNPGPMCLSPGLAAYLGIQPDTPGAEQTVRNASPATYVRKYMPPYLLLHGTKDTGVPYEQSVAMCDAMKRAGASCELITIEGGGHGGWDADPAMRGYPDQIVKWLAAKIQIRAENAKQHQP